MNADIAFAQCAQDGVGDRMCQCIGIGVSIRTTIRSDSYAAQYQFSSFDEPVRISPDSDSKHFSLSTDYTDSAD
jgi:hypothetical protein